MQVLLVLALALGGCLASRLARTLPGVGEPARVDSVRARVGYLEARLVFAREALVFLFPEDAACREALVPGTEVTYARSGLFGRVWRAEATCAAVGTLSLEAWRSRHPRPLNLGPLPRESAHYTVLGTDADAAFLRGRFPLVSLLGIPGGEDAVVVVPRAPACAPLLGQASTLHVYRAEGPPLVLGSRDPACRVEGIALPPPAPAGSDRE